MGPKVEATLVRAGFYPAGGGEFHVTIDPAMKLRPIELLARGEVLATRARAKVAHLPLSIAHRELKVIGRELSLAEDHLVAERIENSRGPGNVVNIEVECEHVTEVFTGFGAVGTRAEAVAKKAVQQARHYLAEGVPVGEYLTDQLLIPLALAGGGAFRTLGLSPHARTNVEIIKAFLDVDFEIDEADEPGCVVRVR